jgi:hypothetical protein
MLQQILQAVSAGGVYSLPQLAIQLNISVELLESMIDDLVRMGYLKPVCTSCAEHCHDCPEANSCGTGSGGRAWTLTTSGKRIAKH